jgi:uncharacterized Tic20 family protein
MMAETNENPAEQKTEAEQPVSPEQPVNSEQPLSPEQPEVSKDARMWSMFCHLAGLAGYVVPIIISGIIAPLVVWQIKKEDDPFINDNGKEAVNFQISVGIYALVSIPLCFVCIGFIMLSAVAIFNLVFLIIAAIKANNGERYRYPLCIRFIK